MVLIPFLVFHPHRKTLEAKRRLPRWILKKCKRNHHKKKKKKKQLPGSKIERCAETKIYRNPSNGRCGFPPKRDLSLLVVLSAFWIREESSKEGVYKINGKQKDSREERTPKHEE
ncbi:hypothetical protein BHE74_00044432 [Ensete ventricosum]|nr:hypothetical protein BHE74_00044432 [Ensete ventricosum]RZS11849.1 hypothetical protein BHM03_00043218 [Ensete ventricosum]